MSDSATYRGKRKEDSANRFLAGEARKPYVLRQDIFSGLKEQVGGPKNADMTISLLDHYIRYNLPSWTRHLCLFMDNGATNKSQFIIHWAKDLVYRGDYDSIRMCFFVPGHGKNDVDTELL